MVVRVAASDLDDLVTVVPQPGSNPLILRGCRGVAVEMAGESIKEDADAFVLIMMRGPVDDIRCGRPDGPIQADLLTADALFKARSQEKLPQSPLGPVDGMRSLCGLPGRLLWSDDPLSRVELNRNRLVDEDVDAGQAPEHGLDFRPDQFPIEPAVTAPRRATAAKRIPFSRTTQTRSTSP